VKETGTYSGTGFIYQHELEDRTHIVPVLVTNKHVLTGATRVKFFFHEAGDDGLPLIGRKLNITINSGDIGDDWWYAHPDPGVDVAVAPIGPIIERMAKDGKSPFYRGVPTELLPSDDDIKQIDVLEPVIFIGYPNGIYDSKNLVPVSRSGVIATPVQLDYEGLPAFLIDASVFPGSSGSPVFLYNPIGYRIPGGDMKMASRVMLLGVFARYNVREQTMPVHDLAASTQIVEGEEAIDLGLVFKSRCISEAFNLMMKERAPDLIGKATEEPKR